MKILHITNGDSTAETLRDAGLGGDILPWRDVLHEGPVPADLTPGELDEVRARFIADRGWGEVAAVRRSFAEREAVLARVDGLDRVVLWFEHDLYDQLQLLQVLDRLRHFDAGSVRSEIIMIDDHPAVERFLGLGQLSAEQLRDLFPQRRPVMPEPFELARVAWRAFREPTPEALVDLARDSPALPSLGAALRRHLEQFPSVGNGLGRTEQQALTVLAEGPCRAVDLFVAQGELEESPFLGDSIFWDDLRRLAGGEAPLLTIDVREPFSDSTVAITPMGERVLNGEADAIELNGIDRWLGGVHLAGRRGLWRRSLSTNKVVDVTLHS